MKSDITRITEFFTGVGLPITAFPDGFYQHDGGPFGQDATTGFCVQFDTGINGLGLPGVFGSIYHYGSQEEIDISFCLKDWMSDGPDWIRKFLAEHPVKG